MDKKRTHEMVLEVLTNARKFRYKVDTSVREDVFGADAAVEQYSRAANTATRKDDFLVNLNLQFR